MSNANPDVVAVSGASPLSEVRYPLKQLLREVEYERKHSAAGTELLDQSEIGAILARRRKPGKAKKN